MSERKWTRGPWEVKFSGGETHLIADGDCIMCDMHYYPWAPENPADWHLIAAAPDLYDALQAMVDYCNAECGSNIYPGHQANQALAKARGETQ